MRTCNTQLKQIKKESISRYKIRKTNKKGGTHISKLILITVAS